MSRIPVPDTRTAPGRPARIVSWPVRFLGTVAALLIAFLGVGLALPGTWSVVRTREMGAPPALVFASLNAPSAWRSWTPWPDMALDSSGPARGAGATMSWDDPTIGDGVFTITGSVPAREVSYEVSVEDGTMLTRGRLVLEPSAGGTRVTWHEWGDFGWNPLMGYAALGMDRMQGAQMEKGLARLDSLVTS